MRILHFISRVFGGDGAQPAKTTMGQAIAAFVFTLMVIGGAVVVWISSTKPKTVAPASQPVTPSAPPMQPVSVTPRSHNYDARDGMDYGYTSALSDDQRRAGQVANQVIMFSYAGQRDGRHQVHTRQGNLLVAAECSAPCEVIRTYTVMDMDELRHQVRVEHLRNVPGMLAGLVLEDAMAGRLERYAEHQGQARYDLWVDQQRGLIRTRIRDTKPGAAPAGRSTSANQGSDPPAQR